jgi:heme exporter protein D
MVTAATVLTLLALLVLLNIEAWRRRTTAEIRADQRRRAAREQAWEAVHLLDREAA